MPINYRVSGHYNESNESNVPGPSEFKPHSRTLKCPNDPAARKRIPGCAPIALNPKINESPSPRSEVQVRVQVQLRVQVQAQAQVHHQPLNQLQLNQLLSPSRY